MTQAVDGQAFADPAFRFQLALEPDPHCVEPGLPPGRAARRGRDGRCGVGRDAGQDLGEFRVDADEHLLAGLRRLADSPLHAR